ncbi:MAG: chemotaxis protein CheA [Caldilineae bacterium]|nr:MAG: chemotaxis protein CheA [Caldilineae bacterium]
MIDLSEFKDLFASEAEEYLEIMNTGLLRLEDSPQDHEALKEVFRAAHSLKGVAATMGYQELAHAAHTLEDLLDELRAGKMILSPALADVLFSGVDTLKSILADVLADRPVSLDVEAWVRDFGQQAERAGSATLVQTGKGPGPVSTPDASAPAPSPAPSGVPTPPTAGGPQASLPQTIRIRTRHLDALLNLVAELVINRSRLWRIEERHHLPDLREALERHDRLLGELRDTVLETRMVPVGQVFNRFPRMVRDLLRERGKEAEFVVEGREIELDRTILERISDPVLHLLRNAVDHGMESPDERERLGKPRRGTIRLCARRERESVIIEVSDDGKGLAREAIVETAIQRGLVTEGEAESMSDQQALLLICRPGFSTASRVTEVSGRGVGMDVVRREVEALHGNLSITTVPGQGTTFRLRVPLTLAIVQALLVGVKGETYAIPLSQVERTLEVFPQQTSQVQRWEITTDEAGEPLLLVEMAGLLETPVHNGSPADASRYAVVVGQGRERVGLVVDRLLGREEIVIRPLPPSLADLPGLAGASILGDGQVILILDALGLCALSQQDKQVA